MGARNLQRRIDDVITRLEEFPHIGTPTARTSVRLVVANPYPYLIYYKVDEGVGEVVILDVRHGARERDGE